MAGLVPRWFPRPLRAPLRRVALATALCAAGVAQAQAPQAPEPPEPPTRSALDAPLLYQLLYGELSLRNGQAGEAYQLILDAARRTRDEGLFRRAVEIALQGRAGDQALQ